MGYTLNCCFCGCGDCSCACLQDDGTCRKIPDLLYLYVVSECTKAIPPGYVDGTISYSTGMCCWEGQIAVPGTTIGEGEPQCQCQGAVFPYTVTMCCSEIGPSGECLPGPCQNCAAWGQQVSMFITGGAGGTLTPVGPGGPCGCTCNPFFLQLTGTMPTGNCSMNVCIIISEVQLDPTKCCPIF